MLTTPPNPFLAPVRSLPAAWWRRWIVAGSLSLAGWLAGPPWSVDLRAEILAASGGASDPEREQPKGTGYSREGSGTESKGTGYFVSDLRDDRNPGVAAEGAGREAWDVLVLDPRTVTGGAEGVARLPGSASYVEAERWRMMGYGDVQQVIRATPGVYFRQEDGFGLFPNLSLRGVSTTRNSKITVMEDGVLMAPAPYADPAAYYTPEVSRMAGLEVLKGSSQVRYGPETTGGVVNYLSTAIPDQPRGRLAVAVGGEGERQARLSYGGHWDNGGGRVGVLFEHVYRATDGFKTIAPAAGGGYDGGGATGFVRHEPLVKVRWEWSTRVPQSLELHYGRTELTAQETYLGLSTTDFRADPFQRYAASRLDRIDTTQDRAMARYRLQPTDTSSVILTLYGTEFARNWYKLDAAGVGSAGALRNPAEILAGQFGEDALAVLRGAAAGRWRVRANNRSYGARGAEAQAAWEFGTGPVEHRLEAGLRWHRDFADRFQWDDLYAQDDSGAVVRTAAGLPGTQENRRAEAEAWAVHLLDRLEWGRWAVTPGLRLEWIEYQDLRRSTTPATLNQPVAAGSARLVTWAPGLGFTYQPSDRLTWLAGVHRGISPPGPASIGSALEEETSLGLEAGLRYGRGRSFRTELILFHTAFHDLIVEQNAGGGGGVGQTANIGRVDSTGLEWSLDLDPSEKFGWSLRHPWRLSFTWTHARLGNDVFATGSGGAVAESIFSGGRAGHRLPYIPDYQVSLGTGLEGRRWGVRLESYYQPSTFASASNSPGEINPDASPAAGLQPTRDSRYGRIDAFFLLDLAAHYQVTENFRLRFSCTNLLDRAYLASRVPLGPRPGPPRTWLMGAEVLF